MLRTILRTALFVVLASCLAVAASAQVFQGVVLDDSTRKPIPRYPVKLLRQYRASEAVVGETRTDSRGLFQLTAREAGVYRLEFGDSLTEVSSGPIDTVASDAVLMRQFNVKLLPAGPSRPLLEFEVDQPVRQLSTSAQPRYPDALRQKGVCGEVLSSFVVDTSGRAEMSTFRIIRSTDHLFSDAVRAGVPRMRFAPAKLRGESVRQLVQFPTSFSVSSSAGAECSTLPVEKCPELPPGSDSLGARPPRCRPAD